MAEAKMEGEYKQIVDRLRASYKSGKFRSLDTRLHQLKQFLCMIEENEDALFAAIKKDINKPKVEANFLEILLMKVELGNAIKNLSTWMTPERVTPDLINKLNTCEIISEPYGVVLVIGAWNYPLSLALQPAIAAIAAGNSVIIKPSELSENTASVIEEIVPKYMDKDCMTVVSGGVPETTALLRQRFDYIFYTGGTFVAKIIMKAAAEYLTPVTLELGGKCPAFVDSTCNFQVIGQRIAWAKYCNAGQTCLTIDYIVCIDDCQDQLIESIKTAVIKFYGEDQKNSESYGRIVNKRHFERVCNLIDFDKVVYGNIKDEEDLYISPTILKDVSPEDKIMQEEIFGPLLPILPMESLDDAIDFVNGREKPLAVYVFSNDQKIINRVKNETSSGGMCINDAMMHAAVPSLPFGGVGYSGMGSYHGKFGFDTFSHKKSYLCKNQRMESVNAVRYPPYDENWKVLQWLEWMLIPMKVSK
ncbi:aldehyde dehydrogenase, dimeric NADP-preferring-like isoform X2 [Hydractinia symbiolongicarpus]|uniref:aldehyde dehydrogenase, dimeric NADP-preferring-like isoform X2 n=1 Tax=Hydractinia symbiolongicarpus TaxID=13093 RepID=UPI00254D227A|nr:aldehyde dehydrogenase, dimeric NADP-preferring-like isoform X2 [Hydractinia symbiolongicarpus]